VLVIMSAIGACASLLMALDYYRRLKDAERLVFIHNIAPGPDSILHTGMAQVVGLAALGIVFLALLLVLIAALKDPALRAAVQGRAPAAPNFFSAHTPDGETVQPDAGTPAADGKTERSEDAETTKPDNEEQPKTGEALPPVS